MPITTDLSRARAVFFTGGEDVDPSMYGDKSPRKICDSNIERDKWESLLFLTARNMGIPMIGVCRGIQFLNVMNGGKLIHHLDCHIGGHVTSTIDNKSFHVSSTHHQCAIPSPDSVLMAWSSPRLSERYFSYNDEPIEHGSELFNSVIEVEALYWRKTKCFAVQWHPEILSPSSMGSSWFREKVEELIKSGEIK
jgi:gamma-glutamyl-gamma-aminobutyrate hydrolase PuuD